MMCALSVGEEEVADFDTLFTAVGFIFSLAHLKMGSCDILVQQLIHIQHFQNK